MWTAIESALSGPLQWPDGTLAEGALPAFHDTASRVSNPGAGYAMTTSDTSRLYVFGSAATYRVGDAYAIHSMFGGNENPGATLLRGFQSGTTHIASGSTVTNIVVTYPTAFGGSQTPTVLVTFEKSAIITNRFGISSSTASFTASLVAGNSDFTLHWSAFGDMAR